MLKEKRAKQEFDGRIWPKLLEFNERMDAQLSTKANFLLGASTVVLMFALNKALSQEFWAFPALTMIAWSILIFGGFVSMLVAMMIVLPKLRVFSRKERVPADVFYYKNIITFYDRKKYYEYLKDLPWDSERIGRAYANQVFSLAQNILPYKFGLLRISGWTLVLSLLLSTLFFLTSIIV